METIIRICLPTPNPLYYQYLTCVDADGASVVRGGIDRASQGRVWKPEEKLVRGTTEKQESGSSRTFAGRTSRTAGK